ncbi:MAG: hypothetical protein J6N76_10650 [Lachnospiraceae bacterium]|nr:hypothetical protein [Lachnospiraceae bacterium]
MKITNISQDNIEAYESLLGSDLSDDIDRDNFRGIGVTNDDDEVAGALVYELFNSDSTLDTRSIIRLAKYEDSESASLLFDHYKKASVDEDMISESVYEFTDEGLADAFSMSGFSKEKRESSCVSFKLSELAKTNFAKKRTLPKYINSLNNISLLQYRSAIKDFMFRGQKGILDDLPTLPRTWFDGDLSSVSISDDKVDGLFLIRTTPSKIIILVLYFAHGPDYTKNLAYMLINSLTSAMELYPPDTEIRVYRTKKASRDMVAKILPQARGKEVFFGRRKEK